MFYQNKKSMGKKALIAFVVLLGVGQSLPGQHIGSHFRPLRLQDSTGRLEPVAPRSPHHKLTLFVFLDVECPIVQKYASVWKQLTADFPQVQYVGVFTRWNSATDVAQFEKTYSTGLRLLRDHRGRLQRRLQPRVTPEVFLYDAQGQLAYRGAVDNWFFGLGRYRPVATEHYLRDAIAACLANKPPVIRHTEAIGCMIGN